MQNSYLSALEESASHFKPKHHSQTRCKQFEINTYDYKKVYNCSSNNRND
jgi:hypothetical protein